MIGWTALALESTFVAIALVLVLLSAGSIFVADKKNRRSRIAMTAVLVAFLILILTPFIKNIEGRSSLASLQAEQIKSIAIGKTVLTRRGDIQTICSALRRLDWCYPTCGTALPIIMVIAFNDGNQLYLPVAYYKKEDGAIIQFAARSQERFAFTRPQNGYVFCPALPQSLSALGVPLPQ